MINDYGERKHRQGGKKVSRPCRDRDTFWNPVKRLNKEAAGDTGMSHGTIVAPGQLSCLNLHLQLAFYLPLFCPALCLDDFGTFMW